MAFSASLARHVILAKIELNPGVRKCFCTEHHVQPPFQRQTIRDGAGATNCLVAGLPSALLPVTGLVKALIVSWLGSWLLPALWLGLTPEKLCKLWPGGPSQDMMTKHLKHLPPLRQVPTLTHTENHTHMCMYSHRCMCARHLHTHLPLETIETRSRSNPARNTHLRDLCYCSLTPFLPWLMLVPACTILWVQPEHSGEPNVFISQSQKKKIILTQAGSKTGASDHGCRGSLVLGMREVKTVRRR